MYLLILLSCFFVKSINVINAHGKIYVPNVKMVIYYKIIHVYVHHKHTIFLEHVSHAQSVIALVVRLRKYVLDVEMDTFSLEIYVNVVSIKI